MTRRVHLNRTLIALWCLAAAAGCAKLTEEANQEAATVEEAAALPEPAVAAAATDAVEPAASDPVPLAAVESNAEGTPDSSDSPVTIDVEPPAPSASSADVPPAVVEPPAVASAVPAIEEPERGSDLLASSVVSPPAVETLDLTSLLTRLRKTKAINLRTKLSVKSESDDLLEGFRLYHTQQDTTTLGELRRSYDSLFLKLHSLLEDEDPPLARDIDRSRGAIWAILANPTTFGPAALSTPTRSEPRA